jgi:hypothetical protein
MPAFEPASILNLFLKMNPGALAGMTVAGVVNLFLFSWRWIGINW